MLHLTATRTPTCTAETQSLANPANLPLIRLAALDALSLVAATVMSQLIRFGAGRNGVEIGFVGVDYTTLSIILSSIWLGLLLTQRVGPPNDVMLRLANGYRDIGRATMLTLIAIAVYSVGLQLQISRAYLLVALPLGFVSLVVNRRLWIAWLTAQRRSGRFGSKALLVGSAHGVADLEALLNDPATSELTVAGTIAVAADRSHDEDGARPIAEEVVDWSQRLGSGVVVVAGDDQNAEVLVRALSWALEGSSVSLIVSPRVGPISSSRLQVLPLGGHQMIYVQPPRYSGPKYFAKRLVDVAASALGLLLLAIPFAVIACVIRLDSPGPAFYRQTRVGKHGRPFTILKFRSMSFGADLDVGQLQARNEHDGPLFKIRQDPRVTRVGRLLRRTSLDELPQLINVLAGQMSLVGPRPPLPAEVSAYGHSAHRRLLLRPGLTGAWQVGGRSDLSWEEGLFLDLFYVENWSIVTDLQIMVRTVGAVVHSRGAY